MAFDTGRITRVAAGTGQRSRRSRTGRPNGLALGRDGTVWVCETLTPSLIRLDPSGSFEAVLEQVDGMPLLWPNDLFFGSDGALYMTDLGVLVRDFLDPDGLPVIECRALTMDGKLIRYEPSADRAEILDTGYQFTNGIAFGPDGDLYVNETMTGEVYRYASKNGRPDGRRHSTSKRL